MQLAEPWLVRLAIDEYIARGDLAGVNRIALWFLLALLCGFWLEFAQTWATQMIGQRIMFDLRMEIYGRLQRLGVSYYDRNPVGRLMTRVTSDVDVLNDLFSAGVVAVVGDVFMLAGILVVLVMLDWRLALITFLVLPLVLLITQWFRRHVRETYRQVRTWVARINAFLQENITGMATVQLFRRERVNFERFEAINAAIAGANVDSLFYYAVFYPAIELVSALAAAADHLVRRRMGAGRHADARHAGGVPAVRAAILPADQRHVGEVQPAAGGDGLLGAHLRAARRAGRRHARRRPRCGGRRARRAASSSITCGSPTPTRTSSSATSRSSSSPASGSASSGQRGRASRRSSTSCSASTTSAAGASSSTASTSDRSIRASCAACSGWCCRTSICSRARLPATCASGTTRSATTTVRRAIEAVHADRFVDALPEGLATPVAERGATLSVGQKQLLSFARALAFNPRVLILDEATSSVDTETEMLVRDALRVLMAGRTTIAIAHRLSTIQDMDQILVFHKGELRERGRHQSLLAERGLYHRLYQLQFGQSVRRSAEGGREPPLAGFSRQAEE